MTNELEAHWNEMRASFGARQAALEKNNEPIGTAGELFTNTALERLDLRPSTGIYITRPQRKPLTDGEITEIFSNTKGLDFYLNFARAIEAAHGIKGEA